MNKQTYVERLSYWKNFRLLLDQAKDPFQMTVDEFNKIPLTTFAADPYDKTTWPDPWEMIEENIFCPFVKILAICYTLQLTDKFSHHIFEINIVQDKENSEIKYLLKVNGLCIGYNDSKPIPIEKLPNSLVIEKSYTMPNLQ